MLALLWMEAGGEQCRRAAVFAASVLFVAQSCLTLFSHRLALAPALTVVQVLSQFCCSSGPRPWLDQGSLDSRLSMIAIECTGAAPRVQF